MLVANTSFVEVPAMLTMLLTKTLTVQMMVTPLPATNPSSESFSLHAGDAVNVYRLPATAHSDNDLCRLAKLDLANDLSGSSPWNERFRTSHTAAQDSSGNTGTADAQPIDQVETAIAYGTQGQLRWTFQGSWAIDVKEAGNEVGKLGFVIDYFVIDNVSINAEFNGAYIAQEGPSAWGFNFNLIARWHVIAQENWSFFIDGGAGLLWTTHNVPHDGSSFNFTPQAGLGFTIGVGGDARVITGVRWLHISNANLYSTNPGRDSIEVYAGITLPF